MFDVKNYKFSLIVFFIIIFLIFFVVKLLKYYFSRDIIVNCWFCNANTRVPHGNRNCFTCPWCDQYNGFDRNGDYNRIIPPQFHDHMNHGIGAIKTTKTIDKSNLYFCNLCVDKQTRFMTLLNEFQPKNERTFDEEYANYKQKLEDQYGLCFVCKKRVQDRMNEVNNSILPDYIHWSTQRERKKLIKSRQNFSIINRLNVVPAVIITSCLMMNVLLLLIPILKWKRGLINTLFVNETAVSVAIFVTMGFVTVFGNIRPSIKFGLSKFIIMLFIILYNYFLSRFNNDFINQNKVFIKLPALIWTMKLLWTFLLNYFRLAKAFNYTKFSLVSIVSPHKSRKSEPFSHMKIDKLSKPNEIINPFTGYSINPIMSPYKSRKSEQFSQMKIDKLSKPNEILNPFTGYSNNPESSVKFRSNGSSNFCKPSAEILSNSLFAVSLNDCKRSSNQENFFPKSNGQFTLNNIITFDECDSVSMMSIDKSTSNLSNKSFSNDKSSPLSTTKSMSFQSVSSRKSSDSFVSARTNKTVPLKKIPVKSRTIYQDTFRFLLSIVVGGVIICIFHYFTNEIDF